MILSAALDSGYVFMALIAILTSVVAAAYYLNLKKNIFFFIKITKKKKKKKPAINNLNLVAYITPYKKNKIESLSNKASNIQPLTRY